MIDVPVKPANAQEYDKPIVHFENYSRDEILEYWRSKPKSVRIMRDYHPKVFQDFVKKYGQSTADEILALA